ncbi:SDR family oxidoreductase [Falsarthrobacter nasiphocae]|uniref:Nucleoside-diphosphate-sugar epimerase n=1 Tax=Falsarthrobacter nasiphocae TaxID=189863 RepID=A0AAE3YGH7_9MICC|nr:SDR family oxidoreductase [Falsarthrobacter nasiphocae]MDR6891508.1 nucleoside-diphosphate-sugar epimerase [Falsarthrobacter nasiphocae]
MKRVLIIGGHGKVALLAAPILAAQGREVLSAARKAGQREDIEKAGGTFVEADVERMDQREIERLVSGTDAVIWSAGAGGGSPERTRAVDFEAAVRTVHAAEAAGVKRFVMVSYFGAGQDHGLPEDHDFFAYAQAKADADEELRASSLDWTILGPSALTDAPSSGSVDVRVDRGRDLAADSASRETVARMLAAVLDDETTLRRTIEFNDGSSSIDSRPWAAESAEPQGESAS